MSEEAAYDQYLWDAQRCEAALAHLERLQERLAGLRSTLPSLVAPMLRQHTSRSHMFVEVKKSAVQSTSDLKDFRDDWESEQTQTLLARSKDSVKKDGDLSKANGVARYGWSTS